MKALLKHASLVALMATGMVAAAQDPWSLSFKMGGGPTFQEIKTYAGDAGYAWGGDFELGYQLSKTSQLAFTLGYRFFPGDFQQVSLAPATLPTRATIGTYTLETRIRKADLQGFQLGALYRANLPFEGYFWQGGLRIAFNKANVTDTGTAFTQTTTAANTAGTITQIAVISSQLGKTVVSPGLLIGAGYRFNDTYSLEANGYTTRAKDPSTGNSLSGSALELTFGIRF